MRREAARSRSADVEQLATPLIERRFPPVSRDVDRNVEFGQDVDLPEILPEDLSGWTFQQLRIWLINSNSTIGRNSPTQTQVQLTQMQRVRDEIARREALAERWR